jgi:hypothetical protein
MPDIAAIVECSPCFGEKLERRMVSTRLMRIGAGHWDLKRSQSPGIKAAHAQAASSTTATIGLDLGLFKDQNCFGLS